MENRQGFDFSHVKNADYTRTHASRMRKRRKGIMARGEEKEEGRAKKRILERNRIPKRLGEGEIQPKIEKRKKIDITVRNT